MLTPSNAPTINTSTSPGFFDVLGQAITTTVGTAANLGGQLLNLEIFEEIIDVRNDILGPGQVSGTPGVVPEEQANSNSNSGSGGFNAENLIVPSAIAVGVVLLVLLVRK